MGKANATPLSYAETVRLRTLGQVMLPTRPRYGIGGKGGADELGSAIR